MKASKAFPTNEAETIKLYRLAQARLGWSIVHLQTACPDAIIAKNGYKLRAEFEYKARNFKMHGHDPDDCDIIICWVNDYPDAPVPVWELRKCAMAEASIVSRLLEKGWTTIMQELQKITHELDELKIRLRHEWTDEDIECYLGEGVHLEIMFDLALRELERRHGHKLGCHLWTKDPNKHTFWENVISVIRVLRGD